MAIEDPTTHANYDEIVTSHVHLEWTIDWEKQSVHGTATHTLKALVDGVDNVLLDTSDLVITGVDVDGKEGTFALGPVTPVLGAALTVKLPSKLSKGSTVDVKIAYATSPTAVALQWLDKEQTAMKTHPYLFSQCQPIYARTLLPCQDTPSVKITYSASVSSVLPVLLSAIRTSPPSDGPPHAGKEIGKDVVTYTYKQPTPIPSYLIALASGHIIYKPFTPPPGKSWTTGVWAEPVTMDKAFWEFSEDTPRFLAKAEDVVAPYTWGVYDLLVLPPSFPYGGMENACLTFLTPTLLAGDRTLVDVIVHELTHSFFGNGVTHAHASHFWLNEGWTTYIERVLQGEIHGPAERAFSYILGAKALKEALALYKDKPKYQQLVIHFEPGEDPDDAYSTIPYEKGSNFLLHIERTLGGLKEFLPFIQDYVKTFTGKSITTEQWKTHLYGFYEKHDKSKIEKLDSIDWDAWFYGQGESLPVEMEYDTSLAEAAYKLAARWDQAREEPVEKLDFASGDLANFNSNQKLAFLERVDSLAPLPAPHVRKLDALYAFGTNDNAEIRSRFYSVALSGPAAPDYAKSAAEWVVDKRTGVKGRMKFCRPLFRSLNAVDSELAKETWTKNASSFHPIARRMIEKDLGLSSTA
ncbi:hypothetical protein EXIGLDRAFT_838751 [Exidia glandulosa HHB12029]|uniref:Peptidase M1 leukotriene A4 hydrolase/aminopeptidase C-terminal domain-containing protein n=1 Tax=Exidia glandulosa HHB12029 TaxID=1314781 RepID=A0A165FIW4_EXIGL|nr:hypothetical protein EXIGLDRAFT_838751 [Exidia glandulosa HHB12029]